MCYYFRSNVRGYQQVQLILYNYINKSVSTNSLDVRAIHLSCPIIATLPLRNKKIKMITLSHMISILYFVSTILFYVTR
jgi:hypothetical protein